MHVLTRLLVGSLLTLPAAAQSIVIPNGLATAEGNGSSVWPWGRGGTGLRQQCVYDSGHFTNQGITSPIVITALAWRPNTNFGLFASSYPGTCTVQLSTSPVDQAAVLNNFAANRGTDLATVFSGPVAWGPQAAVAGPTPFGIRIPLQTPFLFDPSLGDLNIEVDLPLQAFTGVLPQLDVDASPTTARASRVVMSAGYPTGAVSVNINHAVVVEVTFGAAAGFARAASYGIGCINQPEISSYQLFSAASPFDLANSTVSLVRTSTGYLAVPGIVSFVPPSATAAVLALNDDSEVGVTLSAAFPVGATGSTSQLTVCSNGFISAATGNGTGFTPVPATFLNGPVAWWSLGWHDFNPSAPGSGRVKFEEVAGIACITWDGVFDFGGTTTASASRLQAQFDLGTGNVHFVYQTMSTLQQSFLVGVSGAGPSVDPGSMDISAALPTTYIASQFRIEPMTHAASARPVIGTTIVLNTNNTPPNAVFGLTLLGVTEFPNGIDLSALGMPGCRAYHSLNASIPFLPTIGGGSQALAIPANPSLASVVVLSQGAAFSPGINPFGFLATNGLRLTLDIH